MKCTAAGRGRVPRYQSVISGDFLKKKLPLSPAEHVQAGRELAKRVGAMHVMFNNNFEDQGQRNARTLMRLLA